MSYLWVRAMSFSQLGVVLDQNRPVVYLGLWQSDAAELMDMSVTDWDDRAAEVYTEDLRDRSEILTQLYAPLIWADEHVSGVEIVPDA